MKHLLIFFLLLPLSSLACSCDPPPVALEFLTSKHIFYGSVVKKEYAADSQTYTVTFRADRHFKKNKGNQQAFTFTLPAEGRFTGHYTSCDFSVNSGENWLIYANDHKGELTFGYHCSNSRPYRSFDDIQQDELEILETGNKIDVDKIVFEKTLSRLWSMEEYMDPAPKVPLDTLLAQLDSKYYEGIEESHFENFAINIDDEGRIKVTAVHRKQKYLEIKSVYGVSYPAYTPMDSLNTDLQKAIISAIRRGGDWKPATFMGRQVNSQVHLQVYFRNHRKPYASPLN